MIKKADPYTRTSFGRFLQKARIENGISLTDVARQTRIRTQILSAIEKEEHENLPAESFVRGMITAFAKIVGADINEAIRLYQIDRKAYEELEQLENSLNRSRRGGWLKLVFALGLLVGLAVITVYTVHFLSQRPPALLPDKKQGDDVARGEDNTASKNNAVDNHNLNEKVDSNHQIQPDAKNKKDPVAVTSEKQNKQIGVSAGKNINQAPGPTDPIVTMDGYVLSIHATKNTWVKVIADGKAAVKYRLKIGDRLDLTATLRFNMLIGDANGVRLTLNGKPVPVNGKSGQIVNIEVP